MSACFTFKLIFKLLYHEKIDQVTELEGQKLFDEKCNNSASAQSSLIS